VKKASLLVFGAVVFSMCVPACPAGVYARASNAGLNLDVPDSNHVQVFTLRNRSVIIARVVEADAERVLLHTDEGDMVVAVSDIRRVEVVAVKLAPRPSSTLSGNLHPPHPDNIQILTTVEGDMLGRLREVSEDEVVFETETGIERVPLADVRRIREVPASSIRNGKYWFPNPNKGRLFLGPTARPLKRREGYVAGYYIMAPLVAYGLTDNLTLVGGGSYLVAVNMGGLYLMPKVGLNLNDYFALGAACGVARMFVPEVANPTLLVGYGLATLGKRSANLTLGAGYGLYHLAGARESEFVASPGFTVGGELRLMRKLSFVTENYLMREWLNYSPIVSYGIRFFGESFSLDVGFINTVNYEAFSGRFPGYPFLVVAYNF